MAYVIGLTGNIATGKSTVRQMLASLGAATLDADKVAHQVMIPGTPVFEAVIASFGSTFVGPDGSLDRSRLGELVFRDPEALARLEAIVHPAVIIRVSKWLEEVTEPVAVVEAIKLIESGLARQLCDSLWVVTCSRQQQIRRLMRDRGLDRKAAELRVDSQPPQEDKIALADVVIDNSGPIRETRRQVKAAWDRLQQGLIELSLSEKCSS